VQHARRADVLLHAVFAESDGSAADRFPDARRGSGAVTRHQPGAKRFAGADIKGLQDDDICDGE
jgi:hypothetical protein